MSVEEYVFEFFYRKTNKLLCYTTLKLNIYKSSRELSNWHNKTKQPFE